ncbi:MAG TPA: integrin alpha, partial [Planctomycetota bacterium]|nr:integrin alpha [Planctomycetota bacterium]
LPPGPVTVRSGAGGGVLLTIPLPVPAGPVAFGSALAAAGDLNGDGVTDLIVGASGTPGLGGSVASGVAYVYSGATVAPLFTFPGSATGDAFGGSVAGPGDLDGDGVRDILVGARQGASLPGYAKAFSGATGALILTMSGAAAGDGFGTAVARAGDPNGDGVPDFMVGAPGADPGGVTNAGQVRVLSFVGIPPTGTILGTGCPGSSGRVPRISISGGTPNSAGNPAIAIHLSSALAGTIAALIVGFDATSWLGVPLPIDLGILGIPGCSLRVSADVLLVTTTNGSGRAVFPHPTPADPALSGATVYYQWFVVDPGPALLPGALTAGLQLGIL